MKLMSDKIREFVKKRAPASVRPHDVAVALDTHASYAQSVLKELVERKYVEHIGQGRYRYIPNTRER